MLLTPRTVASPSSSLDPPQRLQGRRSLILLGGDGQGEAVDHHVLRGEAGLQGGGENLAGRGQAPFGVCRDAPLVEGQTDHRRPVFLRQGKDRPQALRLTRNRVDQHLAVGRLEAPLQR